MFQGTLLPQNWGQTSGIMATQQCWPESATGLIQKMDFPETACQQRGWVFCHYGDFTFPTNTNQPWPPGIYTVLPMHQVDNPKTVVTTTCRQKQSNAISENRDLKPHPGLCMPCWHPHAVQLYVLQGCTVSISWQTLRSYSKTLNWCSSHVKLLLLRFWYRHLKMIQFVFVETYDNYGIQGAPSPNIVQDLKWQKRR